MSAFYGVSGGWLVFVIGVWIWGVALIIGLAVIGFEEREKP